MDAPLLRLLLADELEATAAETVTRRVQTRIGPQRRLEHVQRELVQTLAAGPVNLIAIGNQGGFGLYLVPLVPKDLRASVVILSGTPLPESQRLPYRDMGIEHFCLRGAEFGAFVNARRQPATDDRTRQTDEIPSDLGASAPLGPERPSAVGIPQRDSVAELATRGQHQDTP